MFNFLNLRSTNLVKQIQVISLKEHLDAMGCFFWEHLEAIVST